MSTSRDSAKSPATWDRREQILDAFESAWQRGEQPLLEEYLPAQDTERAAILVELVRIDLECRINAGEKARVEQYIEQYPQLVEDRQAVLDLLQAEYRWRRHGPEPDLAWEEVLKRFPDYHEEVLAVAKNVSTIQQGTSTVDTDAKAQPPKCGLPIVPGYEIVEELGRGGMGVVYKARQVGLNRDVALKMIRSGSFAGEKEKARFRIEAEAVARLQHPNIVQIHEIGESDGLPYFSLEFCAGGSLANKLRRTPLPAKDAALLVEVMAHAVQAAHDHHLVHRDLKPGNILLTSDGTAKIADFGLAKRLDDNVGQTQTGAVMGTPSYMAPEQAAGRSRQIGPPTDIYALGAILYELVTGRPPFLADSHEATLQLVINAEPLPPRRLQPSLPRNLETICLKCLQKEPANRYSSALALAEDLRRFLSGRPILARPATVPERFLRWCRRNPWAASFILAMLIGTAVSVYFAVDAKHKADLAQKRLGQIEKTHGIMLDVFDELDIRKVRAGTEPLEQVLALRRRACVGRLCDLVMLGLHAGTPQSRQRNARCLFGRRSYLGHVRKSRKIRSSWVKPGEVSVCPCTGPV